jgi:serine/threonine protein kinase
MERHLRETIVSPSAERGKDKEYKKESLLGRGGTSAVGSYRASDSERVAVKVSYCGDSDAEQKAEEEIRNARSAVSTADCSKSGYRLCDTCDYAASDLMRLPMASAYVAPCFQAVYPLVRRNLAQWLAKKPKRSSMVIREVFMQILSIMRCLRAAGWWYNDIKPSNFLVMDEDPVRVQIGDLGGLVRYGDKRVTLSPGQLAKETVSSLSWANLNSAVSTLLGELLLQLLMDVEDSSDTNKALAGFFTCVNESPKGPCENQLLSSVRQGLAEGVLVSDPLVLDMLTIALLLIGFRGMKLEWQDVTALDSAVNRFDSPVRSSASPILH